MRFHGEYEVKIIESQRLRCEYLATQLPGKVLVLQGDCTDEDLLGDDRIQAVLRTRVQALLGLTPTFEASSGDGRW